MIIEGEIKKSTQSNPESTEDKCQRVFDLTFDQYFHQCMDDGLQMAEMYKQLGATRANFRRIMQKYGLSIRKPNSEPMFSEAKNFKAEKINHENVLYRKWGRIISY